MLMSEWYMQFFPVVYFFTLSCDGHTHGSDSLFTPEKAVLVFLEFRFFGGDIIAARRGHKARYKSVDTDVIDNLPHARLAYLVFAF